MATTETHGSPEDPHGPPEGRRPPGRVARTVALFLILAGFWLLLSGRLGVQYFIFLFLSVALVLWLNPERPFRKPDPTRGTGLLARTRAGGALAKFLVWLVWNVIKANLEVAYMILHPRLPIRPGLFRFRTTLQDDVARVLVANSITLTPGTVTIDLKDDEYLVHAIHPRSAGALAEADMQNMVARVFGEAPDPPPRILWGSPRQEQPE